MIELKNIKACIFDIEGTTTPISFVHEILFPYSKEKLFSFLKTNAMEKELFINLQLENKIDLENKLYTQSIQEFDTQSIFNYLSFLIQVDRKSKSLKEIQGKIWRIGYEKNELKSILFGDTKTFFEYLQKNNIQIYIYSSGSVEAQKLIFTYSNLGNLSSYIQDYFDTNIGAKKEINSYKNILEKINLQGNECIFFTDIKEEADAAFQNKINVYIMERDGNSPQADHSYKTLKEFL